MNALLSAALKQAYALAPATVEHVYALEISQEGVSEPLYLVQGYKNRELTIPGLGVVEHLALPFAFSLPKVADSGLSELTLTFDNTSGQVGEFCRMAQTHAAPIHVKFRPYLASDLTTPQYDPALLLFLRNVVIGATEVSGRAVPRDFINLKFANFLYSTRNFPGLVNA